MIVPPAARMELANWFIEGATCSTRRTALMLWCESQTSHRINAVLPACH